MKRVVILLLLGTLVFINVCCTIAENAKNEVEQMEISKEKVHEIANNKAKEIGYDIKEMKVELDKENTRWNEYIKKGPILENDNKLRLALKDRKYWAAYYAPKRIQFGGDLWIFIDKNTGEVITIIQGK